VERADSAGRVSWYGQWRVNGVQVRRKIGLKRAEGSRDGLTRRLRYVMKFVVRGGSLMSTYEDACSQHECECPLVLGPAAHRRRPGTLRRSAGRDVLSEPRNPRS
jgi:hypothetical protein